MMVRERTVEGAGVIYIYYCPMQSDTKLGPAPHEQASGFYLVDIVISCSGDPANDWPHFRGPHVFS